MKLALVLVLACAAAVPREAAAESPCLTLSWSGMGRGVHTVRAWYTHVDATRATIRYDGNGEITVGIVTRNDGRTELKGYWAQGGNNGYVLLMMDSNGQSAAGYWNYAGSSQQYELGLRAGGPRCSAQARPAPPPPPPDPSCGIARGALVYPGCGFVYQSRHNQKRQCGSSDAPLKFIYNDSTRSSCGIRREQTVWSGCGFVYQRQSDWRAQCGQDGTTFKFIPKE
jgi:hypothetical protein